MLRLWLAALMLLCFSPGALPARVAPPTKPADNVDPATLQRIEQKIADAKAAMLTDSEAGLLRAREAAQLAAALSPGQQRAVQVATAHWLEGEALARLNKPDAAKPIIAGALREIARYAPGSELHARLLQSDGWIAALTGDVPQALQSDQRAHNMFRDIGDARGQAQTLMNIGSIYNDAGDYPKVLQYYAQAAEVFSGDSKFDVSMHNNRGNALRKLGRSAEAESEYHLALVAAQRLKSPLLIARILNNIALAQESSGKLAEADATASRGLQIANDPAAAEWRPFLWAVKAKLAFHRGDLGAAEALLGRTFAGVDLAHTSTTYGEFHDFAHRLYARTGEDRLALAHLEAFKRLDDESRAIAASTNAALMAARFDFANQDLRIAKLKTGQLERDILLAKSRARVQAIAAYGVTGSALVIFALLSFGFFKIRRKNLELSSSNMALEKALKAKTEFLATTSHEIRTPLNGILGMTQVILHDPAVTGALRERLQVVQGAGETMKVLVDDILDVAKMETGHIVIDRAEMNLRQLLDEVMRLWGGQAQGKKLDLVLDAADCPQRIVEDGTRLRQILFNLLSNAIKFTDEGSVRLRVETIPGNDGERLRFRIADTGIGIAADQHAHIFEPFHQVDGGTTRRYGGTGLGLAICRNLSQAMGGAIAVESVPGEGSVFTVELPLERVAAAEPAPDADRPFSLADASLLLIERNPLAQSILRATLENEVARYEVAENGAQALDMLRAGTFDAIVAEGVSLTLPDREGVESVAAIVAAAPDTAVVVLWAGLTDDIRGALDAAGAARVLAKPIAARMVLDAVRAAVTAPDVSAETVPELDRMSAA